MNHDKLAIRRGLVYEGDSSSLHAIHPIPVITNASGELVQDQSLPAQEVVFREDSFDPVTRIRRGRFYRTGGQHTWTPDRVHNYPFGQHIGSPGGIWDFGNCYTAINCTNPGIRVDGAIIHLGSGGHETAWRVVGIEKISTGHLLFTLRAVSFLGALPDLADTIKNCDENESDSDRSVVVTALDKLVDAFHVQQPVLIVESARETIKVILTAWIGKKAKKKDLANVIKEIPKDKCLTNWAASIVNRLHTRGKSAALESNSELRPVVDEDAEASIHLVGMLLREIGWAKA